MDNSYGFGELHEQLLIIMDDIDRVCRKYNIEYTISDGSFLGAIRHKGFIPWDDDMDVRMVRKEFDRFIKVYETEMKEGFVIGHPCNLATYSVINTKYVIPNVEHRPGTIVNPWVSIFPMDNVPQNEKLSCLKATKMRLLSGMLGKPPQYANFSKKSRRLWDITSFLGGLLGRKNVEEWYRRSCVSIPDEKTDVYSTYAFNSDGVYKRYPKYLFESYRDYPFEDRVYRGIEKYDEYLTMTYGDYMTPLPPEKRDPRHLAK